MGAIKNHVFALLRAAGKLVAGVIIAWIAFFVCLSFFTNYGRDAAKPFDKALRAHGAVKRCEASDNGFALFALGSTNRNPSYSAEYETSLNREEALVLLYKTGKENGYTVVQATLDKDPRPPVPDKYLKDYYFDWTHKPSTYFPLKHRPVQLTFVVRNDGSYRQYCRREVDVWKTIHNDSEHTAIRVDTELPAARW